MTVSMDNADYIIVGAGVFGVSTALHLARSQPTKKILLVDRKRPNPGAASSDYNKIIRADYPDAIYTSLALRAVDAWKSDPVLSPYFHQPGLLLVEQMGMGRAALECFRAVGHDSGAEILTLEAARQRFPTLKDAHWDGGKEAYYNPESGWGEADGALASATRAAEDAGVLFVEAAVEALELGTDKTCKGIRVKSEDGQSSRSIYAKEKTILCVGAHIAKFLADTAPQWDELQVGSRMVAAAAVQCAATYDPEEEHKFEGMPCHLLGMWHTHGTYFCEERKTGKMIG
jgi:sarcosine oxidase / L-pipecolate oxidase